MQSGAPTTAAAAAAAGAAGANSPSANGAASGGGAAASLGAPRPTGAPRPAAPSPADADDDDAGANAAAAAAADSDADDAADEAARCAPGTPCAIICAYSYIGPRPAGAPSLAERLGTAAADDDAAAGAASSSSSSSPAAADAAPAGAPTNLGEYMVATSLPALPAELLYSFLGALPKGGAGRAPLLLSPSDGVIAPLGLLFPAVL